MPVIIAMATITFISCLAIGYVQLRADLKRQRKTPQVFDLCAHLIRQRTFSSRAFGPHYDCAALLDHIRKELEEIELEPHNLEEWTDVLILALDGAWRSGHSPEEICAALTAKQVVNESRRWPDWRTATPGAAIEHVREPHEKPKAKRS